MAKMNVSLLFISCLLIVSVYAVYGGSKESITPKNIIRKFWCVSQVGAPGDKLQGFLDYACSQYDCGPIQPGGLCFNPNTLKDHASYALNKYFANRNFCNLDIGKITEIDPSYGSCVYSGVPKVGA